MKACVVASLLVSCAGDAYAQGAAFNPGCYFPRVGNKAEIDTIYGPTDTSLLGFGTFNLGPRPGESFGTITSLIPHSSFDAGPDFNLHALKENHRLNFHIDGQIVKIGHFRDTYHNDILAAFGQGEPKLYLEDDAGDYDSSRAVVFLRQLPNDATGRVGSTANAEVCGISLYSDTVLDVIYAGQDFPPKALSVVLCVARGGSYIGKTGDSVNATAESYFHPLDDTARHSSIVRDLSMVHLDPAGPGVIATDYRGNVYYYLRETPFSIEAMAHALAYDTLLTALSDTNFVGVLQPMALQVFPRLSSEGYDDLLLPMQFEHNGYYIAAFKGGAGFGSHRLTIDSAAFIFHPPGDYGDSRFKGQLPVLMRDCGDMAGRGNHMLCLEYQPDPLFTAYCLYELGTELDDRIDMYYDDGPQQIGVGSVDTVTANNDNLQDVVVGEGARYNFNDPQPYGTHGTIQVVYGSTNIPRRPGSRVTASASTIAGITTWPNPIREGIAELGFEAMSSGTYRVEIRDLLGRAVATRKYNVDRGAQSLPLRIPELPSGAYSLRLTNGAQTAETRIVVSN